MPKVIPFLTLHKRLKCAEFSVGWGSAKGHAWSSQCSPTGFGGQGRRRKRTDSEREVKGVNGWVRITIRKGRGGSVRSGTWCEGGEGNRGLGAKTPL